MADVIETTDAAGDTTTAYILGIGQTARGTISSTADHDWYKINLTAGQTYTFALVGTGASHLYDPNLRLFGTDGANLLASNDNGLPNNNSIITFTASTSGAYYLDAGYGSFGNTGQYGLSATIGTKANFDTDMGTGVIDTHATWRAVRGTGATVTYALTPLVSARSPPASTTTARRSRIDDTARVRCCGVSSKSA